LIEKKFKRYLDYDYQLKGSLMKKPYKVKRPILAAVFALAAMLCFSINDAGIKSLSEDYALHQIVLIRSFAAILILITLFMPQSEDLKLFKTKRLGMHLLRGLCIAFANIMFFLGLAALPLAEGTAIFFISPVLITIFSVVFLREKVGIHRWSAVILGFIGVLVIVQPGTDSFVLASLFPVCAAFGYATLHIITRKIGRTEGGPTMSFYIQITFIFVCLAFWLMTGDGRYSGQNSISLEFLLRAWQPVILEDLPLLFLVGAMSALSGYFVSQAYRIAEAGLVAPFEFVAMPLAVFWGFVIFGTIPGLTTILGMVLILSSGLYIIWRATVKKVHKGDTHPRYRR
jgi:drug/metabolite transporter (DMT)-like permease